VDTGARSVRRRKNGLCALTPKGKPVVTFMLPLKTDAHKNHKWFSGHYSRIAGTAGNSPLCKKITIILLKILTYSSQSMKTILWTCVDFGICSDQNKRKRGSEIRILLMPWGAEVGEIKLNAM